MTMMIGRMVLPPLRCSRRGSRERGRGNGSPAPEAPPGRRDPALPSSVAVPKRLSHATPPPVRGPRLPTLLDGPPGLDDRPDGDGDRDRLAGLRHRPPDDGPAS